MFYGCNITEVVISPTQNIIIIIRISIHVFRTNNVRIITLSRGMCKYGNPYYHFEILHRMPNFRRLCHYGCLSII